MSSVFDDAPTVSLLGDRALLLSWPARIDASTSARVHACAAQLAAVAPDWIQELVPAYASLAVVLDADRCVAQHIDAEHALDWLERQLAIRCNGSAAVAGRLVEIPVHYGAGHGPDLALVAELTGLSADEVVRRHAGVDYTVAMIGFAPGFPYLLGLDPSLQVARRDRPRTAVPAGSVGIGGAQTGVYPQQGPGGWQLIGHSPLRLFDPATDPPTLLQPGDRVRFVPQAAGR